jgi:hypothetical protein
VRQRLWLVCHWLWLLPPRLQVVCHWLWLVHRWLWLVHCWLQRQWQAEQRRHPATGDQASSKTHAIETSRDRTCCCRS